LVGVLLLNVVSNMFNLLGIQVYVQYLIKGIIVLLQMELEFSLL
jgi:ribose transport system permease protein